MRIETKWSEVKIVLVSLLAIFQKWKSHIFEESWDSTTDQQQAQHDLFHHQHLTMRGPIPVQGSSWWNDTDGLRQTCFCNPPVEYNSALPGVRFQSHWTIFWIHTDASLSAANSRPAKLKKSSGGTVINTMLGQLSSWQSLPILIRNTRLCIGSWLGSLKRRCFIKKPRIPSENQHQLVKQKVQLQLPPPNNLDSANQSLMCKIFYLVSPNLLG